MMLNISIIGIVATMHRISYMIYKYLKRALARIIVPPKHPLYSRSYVINNEVVSADSYDDTPYDERIEVDNPPSVAVQVAAGERLKPMGSAPSTTMLSDAVFAQQFVRSFEAAGASVSADPVPADPVPADPVSQLAES